MIRSSFYTKFVADPNLFGANVGNQSGLIPELLLWRVFAASAAFQLTLVPSTFLNYCYVTSTEEYVKEDVVEEVLKTEGLVRVDVNAASRKHKRRWKRRLKQQH
jgi:hypothetical protein